MYKAAPLILVVLAFAFHALGQTPEKDCKLGVVPNPPPFHDFPEDKLKGEVRSVRQFKVWNIKPDGRGRLIESKREEENDEAMTFNRNGERIFPKSRTVGRVEHDCEAGRVVAERSFDNKGIRGSYTTYKYDALGRIVEKSDYCADGILERSEIYTSDENGNVVKVIEKQQVHPEHFRPKRYDQYVTTSSTYRYDGKQRLIEDKGFYPDGKLAHTFTYTYDDKDRRVRRLWTDNKGRTSFLVIYTFNSSGRLVEKLNYANSCRMGYVQPDGDFEFCEGTLTTDAGMFNSGTKTVYTYDKRGNWIKQLEHTIAEKDGAKSFLPSGALYRQVIYYKPQTEGRRRNS
ncbi:MAG: hypothetical protein ABL952_16230 [Pyrinomonadaceae bacterium]